MTGQSASAFLLAATTGSLSSGAVVGVVAAVVAVCFAVGYVFAVQSHRITGVYPWHMPPIFWGFVGGLLPVAGFVLQAIARLTTQSDPAAASNSSSGGQASVAAASIAGQEARSVEAPPAPAAPSAAPPASPEATGPWSPQQPGGGWQAGGWQAGPVPPPPPGWQQAGPVPPSPIPPASVPPAPPGYQQAQWPSPLGPDAFQQPAQSSAAAWSPEAGPSAPAATPPPLFGWYPDPTGRHEQRYWDGRHWSARVADNGVRSDDLEGTP